MTPPPPLLRAIPNDACRGETVLKACDKLPLCRSPSSLPNTRSRHLSLESRYWREGLETCAKHVQSVLRKRRVLWATCPPRLPRSRAPLPRAVGMDQTVRGNDRNARPKRKVDVTLPPTTKKLKTKHAPSPHYTEIYLFYTC